MNGMRSRRRALRGEGRSRNAVNPSMEAAGETSLFRTLREQPSPRSTRGYAAAFMNASPHRSHEAVACDAHQPFMNATKD